jgi:soluble P-type ATPase
LKRRLKAVVVNPWLNKKSQEAEAAKRAALSTGAALETVAETRVTAGSSKRSTGLRTYYFAEITDRAALFESLKDHPAVIAVIEQIANDAAKKQIALAGCVVKSEKRAA